jgi:hypothetical protein
MLDPKTLKQLLARGLVNTKPKQKP